MFVIYINALAEVINQAQIGAKVVINKNGRVSILMFADDIALVSEDREKLEKLMELTFKYSQRWRFSFNYEKCAVVRFDNQGRKEIKVGNCVTECTCGKKLGEL